MSLILLPRFLTIDEILEIHSSQIDLFGGTAEVRDPALLESAVAQPQSSFGDQFLHKGLDEMAAAYLFRIVKNHPFVDGNRRTGTASAIVFLELNDVLLDHEKLDGESDGSTLLHLFVVKVAEGRADKAEVTKFFKNFRLSL